MKKTKILLATALLALSASVLAADVQVEQGAIGRWAGAEATNCFFLGKSYKPVDGACYYPVDMAKRPAVYEIARTVNGVLETASLEVIEKPCELEEIDFPKEEYVNLSPEDANRHWGEQAEVKSVLRQTRPRDPEFSLALGKPSSPLPNGDNFGVCRKFNDIDKNRHTGIDYPVGMGNNVLSVAAGTVSLTGDHFFSGQSVYVNHGNGLTTMYFHLSEINVAKGDKVQKGDSIGKIGSTGRSTGPHLHLGARWLNQRINPNLLMTDPASYPQVNK